MFTSRERDSETGLYYYRARMYSPLLGRFMQTDPVGYADGMNWYAYCGNNPTTLWDPYGLCKERGFFGNMWAGAVQGGFATGDTGLGGVIGQTAVGLIPFVGQAADLRDTAASIRSFYREPSWSAAGGVGLAVVGWVPGVGDFIKGGGRIGKKAIGEVGAVSHIVPARGGRLGSGGTRTQVAELQAELKSRGFTVQKGGTLGEEYIPGPGGARLGSAYPDITAVKNGRTLRINTIDTLSDGVTPTIREATNAAKIRSLRPDDHLLLVPKSQ